MEAGKRLQDSYPDLFPRDYGERLERLREMSGLSWEELAQRLGVDDARVMEWRKGLVPSGGEVSDMMHLASSVPGRGGEVMLTEATEDYRQVGKGMPTLMFKWGV